jgi:histidyl-tRNA synthetase
MFKRITGTKDILPEEIAWWQKKETIAREIFCFYNYQEIRPPFIEEASLFNRSLGQSSEIVQKQMFVIKRLRELYALRPEGTASVVRAYIENNLDKTRGFSKLYYMGPMFRAERPQKGRLRQFYHIGCEAIGSLDADLDAEVISLADNLLKGFSITGYKIKINSLGCLTDKRKFEQSLRQALKDELGRFCPNCHRRFKNNPLRILDCKQLRCREALKKIDLEDVHLCSDCKAHFERVRADLKILEVDYEVAPYLVRGLDYYSRTVFEITHPDLGSQDALGAGGRYDSLVKELGGPDVGAIGFALGMERLMLVTSHKSQVTSQNLVYLITLGEEAKKEGLKLLDNLRKAGIAADTDYENKSLKATMRKANDLGAKYVLLLGEDELKKNVVTLKDMESGAQREVKIESLITELKNGI